MKRVHGVPSPEERLEKARRDHVELNKYWYGKTPPGNRTIAYVEVVQGVHPPQYMGRVMCDDCSRDDDGNWIPDGTVKDVIVNANDPLQALKRIIAKFEVYSWDVTER